MKGSLYSLANTDYRFEPFLTANSKLREIIAAKNIKSMNDIQSHTCMLKNQYKPFINVSNEYTTVQPQGALSLDDSCQEVKFTLPVTGSFTSDLAIRVILPAITAPDVGGDFGQLFYKYCSYIGVKLFSEVKFLSGQFVIDKYTSDDILLNNKFFVNKIHQERFDKLNGQQTKQDAFINTEFGTQLISYMLGPQSRAVTQPRLEMIIPLQFDFCKSPERALHNSFFVNSQRVVSVKLAKLSEILKTIWLNTANEYGTIEADYSTLPIQSLDMKMELIVNNLYVPNEIEDILARDFNFAMYRSRVNLKQPLPQHISGRIKLNFKYPVEFMLMGFRETEHLQDFDLWHLFGTPSITIDPSVQALNIRPTSIVSPIIVPIYETVAHVSTPKIAIGVNLTTLNPIVQSLELTSNSITIYRKDSSLFYNSYLPDVYQNSSIYSPSDTSCYLINYSTNPGKYQPSGFFNFSTVGKETYLNYELNSVSANYEVVMSVQTINFIIKNGDSIQLKYVT